jgi:hypothetical protein
MSPDQIQTTQIFLSIGQLCAAAALAVLYLRQARLMRETKELTASIGKEQRTFQEALSRPVLKITISHADSSGGRAPYLRVDMENCGNGPARVRSVQMIVDGRAMPLERMGDHDKAALRLLEKQFTRDVGGFLSSGEYWIGPGNSTPAFAMDLDAIVKRTTIDTMSRRINLKVEYGSIIEEAPPRTAWLRPPTDE